MLLPARSMWIMRSSKKGRRSWMGYCCSHKILSRSLISFYIHFHTSIIFQRRAKIKPFRFILHVSCHQRPIDKLQHTLDESIPNVQLSQAFRRPNIVWQDLSSGVSKNANVVDLCLRRRGMSDWTSDARLLSMSINVPQIHFPICHPPPETLPRTNNGRHWNVFGVKIILWEHHFVSSIVCYFATRKQPTNWRRLWAILLGLRGKHDWQK